MLENRSRGQPLVMGIRRLAFPYLVGTALTGLRHLRAGCRCLHKSCRKGTQRVWAWTTKRAYFQLLLL